MAKARSPRAPAHPPPVTAAQIEEALVYTAYLVEKYGDAYAPMMDAFIRDLDEARRQESPRIRARAILQGHTVDGGLKAIR